MAARWVKLSARDDVFQIEIKAKAPSIYVI